MARLVKEDLIAVSLSEDVIVIIWRVEDGFGGGFQILGRPSGALLGTR